MICAGIDAGSRALKVVLWDADNNRVLDSGCQDQGIQQEELARALFEKLLAANGLTSADVKGIVATGYGRNLIGFAGRTVTEITCHANGVRHLFPEARTIVEIGGQDSKLIRLDAQGMVQDFSMNDRCAAGTGRFLEVVAARLELPLEGLAPLAAQSDNPATISTMCVVFAETEIIGLLASGIPSQDIVAGVVQSMAKRVASMAGRRVDRPVIFTGGVALLPGMAQALESALESPVTISLHPQLTGAIGAAIHAARN